MSTNARGRDVRLPSGRIGEVVSDDGDELDVLLLETGTRTTIATAAVEWEAIA